MPYSYTVLVAGGTSASFGVPFPYIEKAHVHVSVNGVEAPQVGLLWTSPNVVVLPTTPPASALVKIWRKTPVSEPAAVFSAGVFAHRDLNRVVLQILYSEQEAFDAADAVSVNLSAALESIQDLSDSAVSAASGAAVSRAAAEGAAVNADEARDAALGYAQAAATQLSSLRRGAFDTRTDLIAATVPPNVQEVVLSGYTSVGRGGATYARRSTEPAHGGKCQSLDGAWWEITGEALNPAQFGHTPGADATAALQAMFSCPVSHRFLVDGSATYILTGQINLPDLCEIVGGPWNITVAASSPVATRALLVMGSQFRADDVRITVASGYTWLRAIEFGNDVDIGSLSVVALTQQAGYADASPSALMMEAVSRININRLHIEKFDRCVWLRNADTVRIGTLRMLTCYRGVQAAGRAAGNWGCKRLEIGVVECHGDSPNKSTAPGNNALALGAVDECIIGVSYIYDTGEHGIRLFGENIDATVIPTNRFSFGDIWIYRAGRCGFKASSGTSNDDGMSATINYLRIGSLYVEDAGAAEDAASAATHRANNNDFGLFLDRVNTAYIGRFQTYKAANANYNGIHNLNLRNCRRVSIDNADMHSSMDSAVSLQNTDIDAEDIRINGEIVNFGQSGQAADAAIEVYLSTATFRRVTMDVNVRNGINAVNMAGLTGSIGEAFLVRGTYDGLTGTPVVSNPGGNFRNHLRYAGNVPAGYTPSGSSTTTDYALGSTLVVNVGAGTLPAIAGLKTLHLASGDITQIVTSDSGVTLGSVLAGTWRCRGKVSATQVLMQRVDP